jgi:hypothetical protein
VAQAYIAGYLARVRALLYRHELVRVAQWTLVALGAIAIVLPLLGRSLVGSRTTALALLGVGGIAVVFVLVTAIVLGIVVPRRRFGGDAQLARWVGRRHLPLASDLLSSIELANAPARPGAPSPELVEALLESTTKRLEPIDPLTLIPTEERRRARRWAWLAVATNLVLLVAVPGLMRGGWHRLLHKPTSPFDGADLSAVPLVGDLTARLEFPAYAKRQPLELPSSSGDVRGLAGTTVKLRGRVLVPAASAELVIEKPGEQAPKVIAAKVEGDQLSAQLVIDGNARYRVAITSRDGNREIEATPRSIEVEPDQPPVVQLLAPGEPLDVTNLRRVELAYMIEDDFGLASADLVWESGKDHGRKPLTLDANATRVQGKLMWDISEVSVPSGGEVRYWLEAKDNDSVSGANLGKSREFHLRVVSPRERHEETLGRQQEVAEKVVKNLGMRLLGPGEDLAQREDLGRQLRDAIVELGAVASAYEKDPHASDALRKSLGQIHDRLDKLAVAEQKLLPKPGAAKVGPGRFAALDPKLVAELEDDTIALADWLDRERLEGLLDLSDEIAAHQKRLSDLLSQYDRTKDPRLLDEIEREMKAIERLSADLDKHRQGMPEDVLDQYVNRDAAQPQADASCISEVRALLHDGKTVEAQQKLESCRQSADRRQSALEGSLSQLRGDKFGDEQKKLDEVMNELADVAKDQDDIAAEANRIFEGYAEKADEIARDHKREAAKSVGALVDKLRKRLESINESGLTPFAKEELDIVQRRLNDVEHMVSDGDLSEALGMAKQASGSLDTIAGELEAAQSDDPQSKWADATQDALDTVEHARPIAKELIDELSNLSPKPDQIMSLDDQKALDRLRRRQQMNKDRTKKLSDRTKQLGGDLPGDAAAELGKKLGGAMDQMGTADDRMKSHDPSGTRESTRAAADALAKARDRARSAARQKQEGGVNDEPIRIPGADEYKAPEQFREELLEAMKKKSGRAPDGYDDMIKRYYEELAK